ncbi:hypothetical protein F5B22DRAFT_632059 [Xylaria bambusicola]|uniref:uncharacterized protein n=1 Tax=Xylaria bambusicola TaxID=326684 RepID=UPI0020087D04|nr:uncharacterized protein F5B22DRAFT_632059 [Xylaria bambusicola]KAI0502777.1 hypothetical protein F5B22DRAFT_632059 [Xylaria bambusicola]
MTQTEFLINTRRMRYTGEAMAALKRYRRDVNIQGDDKEGDDVSYKARSRCPSSGRVWLESTLPACPPQAAKGRHIGAYALTTKVAPWVNKPLQNYQPSEEVLDLVKESASEFHAVVEKERQSSFGLHDLDAIELTYQFTLEISAAILLAADKTDDPVSLSLQYHTSRAGEDDHLKSWGRLLTNLECEPPIIAQFPLYLLMCQSFTYEPTNHREDYVYSALTGVDWAKGQNKFNDQIGAFEALAWSSVPDLDDKKSGEDRCFWRIALAYLSAMNQCENARDFKAPRIAHIAHDLDIDAVIAARALDTIGSAFMCREGAAWLDDQGMDSLIGTGLVNDVMDLHTDILTGETRNLLRLLYPPSESISYAIQTTSILLSSTLCEVFRAHHRARMHNREDGRISSTSPAYSFSRARHRKIFETLELYINRYADFWDWTWDIYRGAKAQITEHAIAEPLVSGIKRAVHHPKLPDSPPNNFFHQWYDMIEDGAEQLAHKRPLGVSADLAPIIRELHALWHSELLADGKAPGWGREFDCRSDALLEAAGDILAEGTNRSEDMYHFSVAYGRLSMGLPYIAYHTIDAIIMTFGIIDPSVDSSG